MSMQATALESQNQTREGPGVKPAAIRTTGCAEKEREKKVTPEGSTWVSLLCLYRWPLILRPRGLER